MDVMRKVIQMISRKSRDFNVSFFGASRRFLLGRLQFKERNVADNRDVINRSFATGKARINDFAGISTTRREPPKPRGLPFVGTMLSLMAAGGAHRLHEYVDKRHRQLGPVFSEHIGPVRGVFVNSPEDFRRIFRAEGTTPRHFLPEAWMLYNNVRGQRRGLLFMDGDEWLRYRRILNKVMLLPNPTKLMCKPCQEVAENLTETLRIQNRHGVPICNLELMLYQWSIEAMLATLMGSRWQDCKWRMTAKCEYLALMLHRILEYSATLSMIPAKLAMQLKLPAWNRFVEVADAALGTMRDLVPEIIQLGSDGLLCAMMNNGIPNDDVIRIVGDFIIAAGDTTAFSMQWALLLLSSRPDLQYQLFNDTRGLSPENILQHHLLKGVMKETLRLYPVAPFITRYLTENIIINDYFVPKEDMIILSIYSSGRDANNFPHPNEFRPERWTRMENGNYQGVINPYATLPFAMGARSCIGRKLAETQILLALAQFVKNFKIECDNQDSIKMILHMVSVPSRPIKLRLTER